MAIIDTSKTKKPFVVDRDTDVFIGLQLPLHKSFGAEGNFKCTETMMEAVKVNIRNLLQTELKERVFQPSIGIKLRQYLFEPFTEEVQINIEDSINKTFNFWLPFVKVERVNVKMAQNDDDANKGRLYVSVDFRIKSVPNVLESVTIQFGG